jgi:hypothetical protein
MAAPKGNNYAGKAKRWSDAIDRALSKRGRNDALLALDDLAEKLLAKCDEGDMTALKELGDRIEGKPTQSVDVGGQSDNPLVTEIVLKVVNANN